jgi:crossover junction endodeoxyribonuclease RusA
MIGFENVPSDWSPAEIRYTADGLRHQTVRFIVAGQPIQQGNMITGRHGNIYDKTKDLRPWRDMVSWAAKAAMAGGFRRRSPDAMKIVGPPHSGDAMIVDTFTWTTTLELFTGPVGIDILFVRRRPTSMPKKLTRPHTKFPDLDKLTRAVLDSMTGIVYQDDAQVVQIYCRKRYAELGETPGILVTVTCCVEVK